MAHACRSLDRPQGAKREPGKLPLLFTKPHTAGGANQAPPTATRNLYVTNYGPETTEDDIRMAFEPHCEVLEVAMKEDYCFVHTNSVETATAAKAFFEKPFTIHGRPIKVNYARERRGSTGTTAGRQLLARLEAACAFFSRIVFFSK